MIQAAQTINRKGVEEAVIKLRRQPDLSRQIVEGLDVWLANDAGLIRTQPDSAIAKLWQTVQPIIAKLNAKATPPTQNDQEAMPRATAHCEATDDRFDSSASLPLHCKTAGTSLAGNAEGPVATGLGGVTNVIPSVDLKPAHALFAAGMKLCELKPFLKAPREVKWNAPENCVRHIDESATGYGFPLALNGRCSIDPDQADLAKVVIEAWGFDYESIMSAGVRTISTRAGSGGRSQFADPGDLKWIKFRLKLNGKNVTVLELRAASSNLQDVVPGLMYRDSQGNACTHHYANGRTFLDAAPLPESFLVFWSRMSSDMAYRAEREDIATAAVLQHLGIDPAESVLIRDLSGGGLPFPALPKGVRAGVNDSFDVEHILLKHGYVKKGNERFLAPGGTGSPGVRKIPKHESLWQSDHGSDPLNGTFDAVAALVILDFKYNESAFVAWALRVTSKAAFGEGDLPCLPSDDEIANAGAEARREEQRKENRNIGEGGELPVDLVVERLTADQMEERCIYVVESDCVVDRNNPHITMTRGSFNNKYVASKQLIGDGDDAQRTPATKLWFNRQQRKTVDTITWRPGYGEFTESPEGLTAYNSFRTREISPFSFTQEFVERKRPTAPHCWQ